MLGWFCVLGLWYGILLLGVGYGLGVCCLGVGGLL
jgi:hypothetical protein